MKDIELRRRHFPRNKKKKERRWEKRLVFKEDKWVVLVIFYVLNLKKKKMKGEVVSGRSHDKWCGLVNERLC